MKKVIAGTLLICVLTVLSGCSAWNNNSDGIKIIEQVENWTEALGKKQITKDSDLCGERTLEQSGDYYSGSYNAQVEQMTGRDVVFGGAGVEERTVICNGNIETKSGSAEIRVRMNEEVVYISPDDNGYFEKVLSFESGGNYIMVDYEDFTGSIDLRCTGADGDEE
ncbi:hypothetical protein ACTNEW_03635 [Blautia sp. HCP3S3_G3]|uniref:hypothetical protein n=1 Tax=Blautia sp. HCP3S3_G3 TaxID=3438913 RepID=UPI003F8CD5DA